MVRRIASTFNTQVKNKLAKHTNTPRLGVQAAIIFPDYLMGATLESSLSEKEARRKVGPHACFLFSCQSPENRELQLAFRNYDRAEAIFALTTPYLNSPQLIEVSLHFYRHKDKRRRESEDDSLPLVVAYFQDEAPHAVHVLFRPDMRAFLTKKAS